MRLGALHQEVRLGSHDQSKGLQRRCYVDLRINQAASTSLDFAKIVDVTIRRDGP